jgi:hypothetical protein
MSSLYYNIGYYDENLSRYFQDNIGKSVRLALKDKKTNREKLEIRKNPWIINHRAVALMLTILAREKVNESNHGMLATSQLLKKLDTDIHSFPI